MSGKYQPLEPSEKGFLWSEQLELYLGIYEGLLRYCPPEGELVPTPEEEAKSERQQKEIAQQRAEKLAAKLRELNIDPDTI